MAEATEPLMIKYLSTENEKDVLGNNTSVSINDKFVSVYKFSAYEYYLIVYVFRNLLKAGQLDKFLKTYESLIKIELRGKTDAYKKIKAASTIGDKMTAITERMVQITVHLKTLEQFIIEQSIANSATAGQMILGGVSNVLSVIPTAITKIVGMVGSTAGTIIQGQKNKNQSQLMQTVTADIGLLEQESLVLRNEYLLLDSELKKSNNTNASLPANTAFPDIKTSGTDAVLNTISRSTGISNDNLKTLLWLVGGFVVVYFIKNRKKRRR
jgi:hypothetical protein